MPAQSLAPSADEPTHGHTYDADHELFDEDSLREDQPYAELEDDPKTNHTPDGRESEGRGSW
jgi:hypothetical protein